MAFHRESERKKPERGEKRETFQPFHHGANCCGDGLALVGAEARSAGAAEQMFRLFSKPSKPPARAADLPMVEVVR
jgi:hypothetical protein